jgi:hypothetical protein
MTQVKFKKAQTFVWGPIECFNLEPRFLTWTLSEPLTWTPKNSRPKEKPNRLSVSCNNVDSIIITIIFIYL